MKDALNLYLKFMQGTTKKNYGRKMRAVLTLASVIPLSANHYI